MYCHYVELDVMGEIIIMTLTRIFSNISIYIYNKINNQTDIKNNKLYFTVIQDRSSNYVSQTKTAFISMLQLQLAQNHSFGQQNFVEREHDNIIRNIELSASPIKMCCINKYKTQSTFSLH